MKKFIVNRSSLIVLLITISSLLLVPRSLGEVGLTNNLLPSTAFAQIGLPKNQGERGIKVPDLENPEATFGNVFNNTIALLFTVGALGFVIMFVWGTVDWILSGGDKEKIAGARKRIVTAIVGLALMALTFVVMIVLGQILGITELRQLGIKIPTLTGK